VELGLSGKRALVTGGSKGIGREIARSLLREGARVFISARGEESLAAVAAELGAMGEVHVGAHDVATLAGARAAVTAAIAALGGLDVLVNNVGGSLGSGSFDKATPEQWAQVMDTNLNSAVWCSQVAVEHMSKAGGGAIVHVNSICGLEYCSSGPYTAAKAAMTGLTKEMGVDLARHNIRVNGVAPGSVMFPGGSWDKRAKSKPEIIDHMLKHDLPFGRFGKPEEIAEVVTFVASARASWMTGTTIAVDGGQGRGF
jgi:3-oxoacyl-[acyl-carrier protein] reductase